MSMIDSMAETAGEYGLVAVGKLIDAWKSGVADSYVQYTQPLRVMPALLVDSDMLYYEHTPVVTQALHSAFSAYYLLAWNMLQASIDNITVIRHLDKLNPSRSVKNSVVDAAGAVWNIANESYQHRLPQFAGGFASNEARIMQDVVARDEDGIPLINKPAGLAAKSTEVIKEASSLAVGKILEVQISNGENKATLPVLIQMQASVMVPDLMSQFLGTGNIDDSMSSRYIKWKTGQIGLLDILTGRDIVKERKKALANDRSGMYAAVLERQKKNSLSGLLTMNPSVANASNLVVVSSDTIRKTELKVGGSFDDYRLRQKLFDSTGLFIVAVVDKEWDRVKLYTHGIAGASDISIKEAKLSNAKEGSSISDILKAYSLGKTPGF